MEEKRLQLRHISVNYKIAGEGPAFAKATAGKPAVFILHGWGASSASWVKVMELLSEEGFQVICPDLPGFGKTHPPSTVWGIQDYIRFVKEFAEELWLQEMVLVGHSFGGQLAVALSVEHPSLVTKLVLVAPAAIRRKPGSLKRVVHLLAKIFGMFLFLVPLESLRTNIKKAGYKLLGRRDYLKATGIMREIMVQILEEDLSPRFPEVSSPVLLVWGDKDHLVPLEDAEILKQGIPTAELEILSGRNHAPNLEAPGELAETILRFLRKA